jgi:hypothetical protein
MTFGLEFPARLSLLGARPPADGRPAQPERLPGWASFLIRTTQPTYAAESDSAGGAVAQAPARRQLFPDVATLRDLAISADARFSGYEDDQWVISI